MRKEGQDTFKTLETLRTLYCANYYIEDTKRQSIALRKERQGVDCSRKGRRESS